MVKLCIYISFTASTFFLAFIFPLSINFSEVATNPEYRRRISRISRLVHDQPDSPKERAVWWLEYLLRNEGAAHLNQESFARNLSWPQILLLDVLLLTIFILALLGLIVWFVLRRINSSGKSKVD